MSKVLHCLLPGSWQNGCLPQAETSPPKGGCHLTGLGVGLYVSSLFLVLLLLTKTTTTTTSTTTTNTTTTTTAASAATGTTLSKGMSTRSKPHEAPGLGRFVDTRLRGLGFRDFPKGPSSPYLWFLVAKTEPKGYNKEYLDP